MPMPGKSSVMLPPRNKRKAKPASPPPAPQPSPPPKPTKRSKTKPGNAARTNYSPNTTTTPYDKTGLFEMAAGIMEKAQHLTRKAISSTDRLLSEFYNLFYMKNFPTPTIEVLNEHQRYVAGVMWKMALPAYVAEKGRYSDAFCRFFNLMVLTTEDEEDLVQRNIPTGKLKPFFFLILKCIRQNHCDQRSSVRLKITELLLHILTNFNNHPAYQQSEEFRQSILTLVVKHRIRDKVAAVRAQAFLCFGFFRRDESFRKTLVLMSNRDPSEEARRAIVRVLSLSSENDVFDKTKVLTERIYDVDDSVRREAFKGLSNIPLSKIEKSIRLSILEWGMKQTAKVKEVVAERLLKAWLRECKDSLVVLFIKLDITVKPRMAHLLLDALYPEAIPEIFEKVDLSFLKEDKTVPLDNFSVEKTLLWFVLCEKFKDSYTCIEKLLPEPTVMCAYIEGIVDHVLAAYVSAKAIGHQIELTYPLGLTHVLKILEFYKVEESAKRKFLEVLRMILMDQAFEEVIAINVAVDVIAKLMEHDGDQFDRTMSLLVADIFGEEDYAEGLSQDSNNADSLFGRRRDLDSQSHNQPFSPRSNATENSCIIKPGVSTIKGLVILTRVLCWSKRINETIRTVYHSKIINSLEDEDHKVRGFTLCLCGIVGITERDLSRQTFTTLMKALEYDMDKFVQESAFKSLVDLLLHYRLEEFQQQEFDGMTPAPEPFNDPNATNEELQVKIIAVLQGYAEPRPGRERLAVVVPEEERPNERELLRRVKGFVKLLLRGRLTSAKLLIELISIFADHRYQNSELYTLIRFFLEGYPRLSLANAHRMASTLIPSIRNLVKDQDYGGLGTDVDKIINPIVWSTSSVALSRHQNSHEVHEKLALNILETIEENLFLKENTYLAQALKLLDIVDRDRASTIWIKCHAILQCLASNELKNDGLKTGIRAFVRFLFKRFGDLFAPVDDSQSEDGETESQPMNNEGENDEDLDEDALSAGDKDKSNEDMEMVEEN